MVFSEWDQIFKDPLTTAAAIDRVVDHSLIVEFGREIKSFRAEEAARRTGIQLDGPGAARAVGKSGDQGIDGIIDEDRLGLDVIYVQAKKWSAHHAVGRPEIQTFVGALHGKRARKGIFITTSRFTDEARQYAGQIETKVVLIDGDRLTDLMIDHDVGISLLTAYEVKRVDSDYCGESVGG